MADKLSAAKFVSELEAALNRQDGYIMGATGQNPKNWKADSWWFTQYSGSQKTKALYWREHAARVWDCNGLAEGLYKDHTGTDINTKARYNYQQWCDPKGTGMIPNSYKIPGAAVFWGNTPSDIHHVAYLYKPVDSSNPNGDWYLIEARGVAYGVVKTKLNSRKPVFWGLMTKYFDYSNAEVPIVTKPETHLGNRILKNGMTGEDVKEMQTNLIRLGFDCGKWGADGDFGDATEMAVRAFQSAMKISIDGEFGPQSLSAMEKAMSNLDKPVEAPKMVEIVGGNCYVRTAPNTSGKKLGVVHAGTKWTYQNETSETGWNLIDFNNQNGWVSGKYSKLVK